MSGSGGEGAFSPSRLDLKGFVTDFERKTGALTVEFAKEFLVTLMGKFSDACIDRKATLAQFDSPATCKPYY